MSGPHHHTDPYTIIPWRIFVESLEKSKDKLRGRIINCKDGTKLTITYPAKRCCATGCGDKIKGPCNDYLIEVTFPDGTIKYLEECCVENFEHGHPDYGYPMGKLKFEDHGT